MTNNNDKIEPSVWRDIIALWRYLGKRRRMQFALLLALMLVAVFAEVISIGAVIPFLTALTSPDTLLNSTTFAPILNNFGITESDELLLPLTVGFILFAVFAALVRIVLLWANARMTAAMGVKLRSDLYTRVLYQPYEYHVSHNSSDLISTVTEKVGAVISNGIMQVLLLASASLLSLSIILTLLWIDVSVAITTFIILGGGYILVGLLVRKRIKKNSHVISQNQPQAIKCMQEGIGGIRDVIMDGSQAFFGQLYTKTAHQIQFAQTQNGFLGSLPKPLLEMLGISMIALLAYLLQQNNSVGALPILGALALGSQRLLPGLQQVYFSWSAINGSQALINDVVKQLQEPEPQPQRPVVKTTLSIQQAIHLKKVSFSYNGHQQKVLKGIDLTIPKGSRVGFIGETGSGKSTLLDIVMGLLTPSSGQLSVDGQVINKANTQQWQRNIAHVSQVVFLSDASLLENIAFGIPVKDIDHERVHLAAQQAQIADHIDTLAKGYQTLVGERGIRLSGGQRQRIGIARALYKKTEVIILDEATSALDNKTEASVMSAVEVLSSDLTILIIAHRLTTLAKCDVIHQLNDGQLINSGSFAELAGTS